MINRTETRTCSFFVLLLLVAGLSSRLDWFALLACFDLCIRGFTRLPISPLKRAAQAQIRMLKLKPKMINAGPRIYDARIGFFVTSLITILAFSGLDSAARILTYTMIIVSGLAAFLGVCIGCLVHTAIRTVEAKCREKEAPGTRDPNKE